MRDTYTTDVLEFASNEFTDGSLIPGAVIRRSYDAVDRHMTHRYWNMLERIKEKKVTFEQLQIFARILDVPVAFPEDNRLLLRSTIATIHDRSMLKYETDIHRSAPPFDKIAEYRSIAKEFYYPDPKTALFAGPSREDGLTSDIATLAPAAGDDTQLKALTPLLRKLGTNGNWLGPVTTRHVAIADYCQYAQLAVFLSYAGPVLNICRAAVLAWLKDNEPRAYPQRLAGRLDYRNWKVWIRLIKTFYLNDSFIIKSYYLRQENTHYLRHELFTEKPEMLANVMLEEYTI